MVTATPIRFLPGIPELADRLLEDALHRPEDVEMYDASRQHLIQYMEEMNSDGDPPEALTFYGQFLAGFHTGFEAGRQSAHNGPVDTTQQSLSQNPVVTARSDPRQV